MKDNDEIWKSIMKDVEKAYPIFCDLFEMSSTEIKDIVKKVCSTSILDEEFFKEAYVQKKIENDDYSEILVHYGHVISITPYGVNIYYGTEDDNVGYVQFELFKKYIK